MARIAPLDPPYRDDVAAHFARIMPPGIEPLRLFRTLAAFPRAWEKFRAGSLLDKGSLGLREREIVIDRTCARAACAYEWGVHIAFFADRVGLSKEQVDALANGAADAACWSAREAALIAAVDALHERCALDDAEFAALRDHFDDAQIVEILMLAGFYRTVAYLANGLALPPEPYAAPLG